MKKSSESEAVRESVSSYEKDFSDFGEVAFLDCAYQGPFPRVTAERIRQAIELKNFPYRLQAPDYFDLPDRVRTLFARIIRADPDEIAVTNSATHGIGAVANGLDLKPGDEVIVSSGNFPANLFTWLYLRERGVTVHVLHPESGFPTPEDVAAAVTPRTRVAAFDYVSYTNGCRIDVPGIKEKLVAQNQDALLVLDATQACGAFPIDVAKFPADVVASPGYKWLLGPYGTGFAFFRQSIQSRLKPTTINWVSVKGAQNFHALPTDKFTLMSGARVFDVPETANFLNLHALEASLEYVLGVGVLRIQDHCMALLDRMIEGLREHGYQLNASAEPPHRSTILTFRASSLEATERLFQELKQRQILVSLRHDWIRVSPHLYNSLEHAERLLEAAKACKR